MKQLLRPNLIIPLSVFLLARLAAHFMGIESQCYGGWTAECWSRWDSGLYLQIAEQGHNLVPCPDWPGAWCGNAGWAPLYPLLIKVCTWFGAAPAQSGLWLSQIFFLGLMLVAAELWEVRNFAVRNWLGLIIVGFAPGSIYFQALFPVSLVVFLLMLLQYYLTKESYLKAGICGFLAVLSYSGGVFLLICLALWGLMQWIKTKKFPWQLALKTGLVTFSGMLAWWGYDAYATGHWNAMFLIQQKYGHGLHSPLKHFGMHLKILLGHSWGMKSWVEVQNLIIMTGVIAMAVWIILRRKIDFMAFQALFIFIFWMFPYSVGMDVSLYRGCALLTPGFAMFKTLPLGWLWAIAIVFMVLWFPMSVLFFQSIII